MPMAKPAPTPPNAPSIPKPSGPPKRRAANIMKNTGLSTPPSGPLGAPGK